MFIFCLKNASPPCWKIWLEAQLLPPLPLAEMDKEMHTMDKEINTRKIWLILNLLVDIKEFCAHLLFGKGIGNYCSFFFEEKKEFLLTVVCFA